MKHVRSFPLGAYGDSFGIHMPENAKFLRIGGQGSYANQLWFLVDPNSPNIERHFKLISDGQQSWDDNFGEYLGYFLPSEWGPVVYVFKEGDW